jgi:hypothetical protein
MLTHIVADCGRPAFMENLDGSKMILEREIQTLSEPRPTNLDVSFESEGYRLAIECKLTIPDLLLIESMFTRNFVGSRPADTEVRHPYGRHPREPMLALPKSGNGDR